jgi:molybdenum cofactor biosynthesis enzyme MoaA
MAREVFGPDYAFLSRDELLAFEAILRLVRVFADLVDEVCLTLSGIGRRKYPTRIGARS